MSVIVKNVSKLYGQQKALDNVSFEINAGEIVGFIGPNGAGKSTMMKIISGYLPQSSGEVTVNGFDVETQALEVKKTIGYLPEHNPLYLDMYVKEYLEFVAGMYKLGKNSSSMIENMIEKTGLQSERHKKLGALSKGYRQRVGLAQTLIHNPSVLILDEPTSGLDPNQIIEIRNLISEIGKEKTIMLSTHIMQEVEAICHKVIIINKGKIVADDSAQNIQHQLPTESQIVLVEFKEIVDISAIEKIDGVLHARKLDDHNWIIESAIDKDIRQDIFELAVKNKWTVLSMQKKEKSLEQAFQELTK